MNDWSDFYEQRLAACAVASIFCVHAYSKCMYLELLFEVALTTTSLLYHGFRLQWIREFDMLVSVASGSAFTFFAYKAGNYYPLLFLTAAGVGYITKSLGGSMRNHFLYVHIPALLAQASTNLGTQDRC